MKTEYNPEKKALAPPHRTTKGLSSYIADYIQEEFYRGKQKSDVDRQMILDAIDAYDGGAR